MVDPVRPVLNADIEEEWGQWVHDRQVNTAPQFVGRLTSSYTIPADSTHYAVPLNTIDLDVGSRWQTGSSSWKAPRAGWIEASATTCIVLGAAAAGNVIAGFWKNTVEYRFGQSHSGSADLTWAGSGTRPILVAVDDLIALKVYANYPGVTKGVYSDFTFLSIRYLN